MNDKETLKELKKKRKRLQRSIDQWIRFILEMYYSAGSAKDPLLEKLKRVLELLAFQRSQLDQLDREIDALQKKLDIIPKKLSKARLKKKLAQCDAEAKYVEKRMRYWIKALESEDAVVRGQYRKQDGIYWRAEFGARMDIVERMMLLIKWLKAELKRIQEECKRLKALIKAM